MISLNLVSSLSIVIVLFLFGLVLAVSKKDLYASFTEGAAQGLRTTVGLLPTLVLLMTSISMLSASGASEMISSLVSPLLEKIGVPSELTPLILIRPVSGSGSTALLSELYSKYGADSIPGLCASVMFASTDTVVYVIAVYFSAARVKHTRHTLPVAAAVMLLSVFLSCALVRALLL